MNVRQRKLRLKKKRCILVQGFVLDKDLSLFNGLGQCLHPAPIPFLLTLDKFYLPYLYGLFSLADSITSDLHCTWVEVTTLRSGHIWSLSFHSWLEWWWSNFNSSTATNVFKGVQYKLRILKLLRHIKVCSDAIVWKPKLRCRIALILLLSTLRKSVF